MPRIEFCPCYDDVPDPCPACGATVAGNDPVRGVCQAMKARPRQPDVMLVLVDKESGEIVASTR